MCKVVANDESIAPDKSLWLSMVLGRWQTTRTTTAIDGQQVRPSSLSCLTCCCYLRRAKLCVSFYLFQSFPPGSFILVLYLAATGLTSSRSLAFSPSFVNRIGSNGPTRVLLKNLFLLAFLLLPRQNLQSFRFILFERFPSAGALEINVRLPARSIRWW